MQSLQTLGRVDISGGTEVGSLLGQPRRLALLIYLAAERNPRNRDVLQAVFWPEQPAERARHALNQSLHVLRSVLGRDAIVSTNSRDVGINPELVHCDAAQFLAFIAEGERERALQLYEGDFLAGFFISDAPDFERWVDSVRAQCRTAAVDAAILLSETASDTNGAVRWARRACDIAPENERATRQLMRTLAARGEAGAALRAFEELRELLEREFELSPSDETMQLAKQFRAEPAPRIGYASARRRRTLIAALGLVALLGAIAAKPVVVTRGLVRRGDLELRHGRFASALTQYQRAVALDSTLAFARYRIALVALPAENYEIDSKGELKRVLSSRNVPEQQQRLAGAALKWLQGDGVWAEVEYRRVLSIFGDDAEAAYMLGETLFHYNPLRGRPFTDAAEGFEKALALDPHHWQAAWHLSLIRLYEGRHADALRLLRNLAATKPEPRHEWDVQLMTALARRDTGTLHALAPSISQASEYWVSEAAWRAAVYARNREAAWWLSGFLVDPKRTEYAQVIGRRLRHDLALAAGDTAAARYELTRAMQLSGAFTTQAQHVLHARFLLHPLVKSDPRERAAVRAVLPTLPEQTPEVAYLDGMLSLRNGNTARAQFVADSLLRVVKDSAEARRIAHGLKAHAFAADRDSAAALAEITKIQSTPWYGWALADARYSHAAERRLHADLLVWAGQREEAQRWYRSLDQNSIFDLAYARR